MDDDLIFLPAYKLAEKIRDRACSAVEVVDLYFQQIAKDNSRLNALVTLDEERARQRAKEADEALARGENWGVLHGVPITIKDCLETAGILTTSSHKPLANYLPSQDATAVTRLKAAGAIILGKTNIPELAGDYQSNSPVFGRANNPWNLDRTPGGSTGGGAAALAAGMTALELGSDIGGSVRQPAHFCGVFSLKPTDRLIPTTGHIPELAGMPKTIRQMLILGPLARSVEDLRLCLPILAGADICQPEIPPVPLNRPPEKALQEIRIAWTDEFGGIPVAAEIRAAIEKVANTLAQMGCQVERWVPQKFDFAQAWEIYGQVVTSVLFYAQPAALDSFIKLITLIGRDRTQGESQYRNLSFLKNAWRNLLNPSLRKYFEALTERDRFCAILEQEMEPWDVWLCPVAATTAFTHRLTGMAIEVDEVNLPYMMANGAYTTPFNLTGNPVVVIPIARSQDNLPIGIQIVGKRWQDMALLAIAQKIAEITEFTLLPPVF